MTPSPDGDILVLFGVSGDLAAKMILPALYRLHQRGVLRVPVIGVASSDWDDAALRDHARAAVIGTGETVDEADFSAFAATITYMKGDYGDQATFVELESRIRDRKLPVFYLAIPPSLFEPVCDSLRTHGLNRGRVVVEKPFGHDLASAQELNQHLQKAFPESAIFRMDHYLGKEATQNLLVFRFGNSILEPLWNRSHIAHVEITMAESFGVGNRGSFYESVGALRDVVQNHMLQLVTLLAMEPPPGPDPEDLRNAKSMLLRSMRAVDPAEVVRGQYDGYRQTAEVAPDSQVETYLALRLHIDSWRWAGVPFCIRAGKAMADTALEAMVQFREPPRLFFAGAHASVPQANQLRFRLTRHHEGVTVTMQVKEPGEAMVAIPDDLHLDYAEVLGTNYMEPYERLIEDALAGRPGLFAREDAVEAAWRVVDPVLAAPPPVVSYAQGSWGPSDADRLVPGGQGWARLIHPPDDAFTRSNPA